MEDIQYYAILFLVWLVSTLVARAILSKTRPNLRLPPSPLALPIIGHFYLLGPFPHQSFHKLSIRYGPLMLLRLGSVPTVIVSSVEAAKEILKTHETAFTDRPSTSAIRLLSYDTSGFIFGPYGPYWKFMKKLCMSELLNGRTLDLMLPIRRLELRRFLQLLAERSEAGKTADMGAELMALTNSVISTMAMRKRCSTTEGDEVHESLSELAELVGRFNLGDFNAFCKKLDLQGLEKRFKDLHRRLDRLIEGVLKEHLEERRVRRETGVGRDFAKDFIDILLDISEDEKAEMQLTRENIKAFVLDVFSAGTDTSSVTMEWTLAELINNPTIFKKAREEIDAVVGKDRLVEESDIPNLPYIQAIIKEALRLHPPGPLVPRKSVDYCKVSGYDIPPDAHVYINIWSIARNPDYWEDPLEFRPERFMPSAKGGSSPIDVRGQHYHLLPFGSGRRACPGITLAMQVMQTTVAAMVQAFDWKISSKDGGGNERVDMTEGVGIIVPMAKPLVCFPIARINPSLMHPTLE
ncbi:hypothetical protein AAC387_Pa03g3962 [Persea americana]